MNRYRVLFLHVKSFEKEWIDDVKGENKWEARRNARDDAAYQNTDAYKILKVEKIK